MQRQDGEELFWSNDLLILILACVFGLIIGIACVKFSGLLVFGIMAAGLLLYAILKRPEMALLGILIATASIIFEDQLPTFSVGITLHLPDLLFLGLFGLIILRWFVNPNFKIVRTPLDLPFLVFFSLTLFSTFVAMYESRLDFKQAIGPIRIFSYYLAFFIVTNIIRERRQLDFLVNGLFVLATIVAAAMVAQYVVGSSVTIIPGYAKTLNTQGTLFEGVTRILPPGVSIVLLSFVTLMCILVLEKFRSGRWLKIIQVGLLGIAFSLTFLRSFLAALLIIFALLIFILRGGDRQKLLNWSIVTVSSLVLILIVVTNIPNSGAGNFVAASIDRYSTLFEPETFQGQDSSLNWRKIENGYAISKIVANPWIGLGLKFIYRPWDTRLDGKHPDPSLYDFRTKVHNGHFMILLQSGLLGYLSFMWLSLSFLMRGFRYWRSATITRMQGITLGFTLVYLVLLIAAVANGIFTQWSWTPVIGIMMGVNEVIFLKSSQDVAW